MSQSQRQRMFIVYELRKPNGEVFYVGKGNTRRERLKDHLNEALRLEEGKTVKNRIKAGIIRNIQRTGEEVQYVVVFESIIETDALEEEKRLIAKYGRIIDGSGILANLTLGGEGACGWTPTEETRAKMRRASLGRKHSEETKIKISEKAKLRKHSEETKRKISNIQKGKVVSENERARLSNLFLGRQHTEETKAKISKSRKGSSRGPHTEESRRKMSEKAKLFWARKKGSEI